MKPTNVFQTVSDLIKEEFKHILNSLRMSAGEKNTKAITWLIQQRCARGWESQKVGESLIDFRAAHDLATHAGIENATVAWLELELGILLDFDGLRDEALQHFDRGFRLERTFPGAGIHVTKGHICAGVIQASQGNYDACFDHLSNLMPLLLVDLDPYYKAKLDWLLDILVWNRGGLYEKTEEVTLLDLACQVGRLEGDGLVRASGALSVLQKVYPEKTISAKTQQMIEQLQIPEAVTIAERKPFTEKVHGTVVSDDFRWLETPSAERAQWCQRNSLYALHKLGSMEWSPLIAGPARIAQGVSYLGVPYQRGGYWFYWLRKPRQHGRSFYFSNSLSDEPIEIVSQAELEKSNCTLQEATVSPTGNLVAYGVSTNGSDWRTWRISRVPDCESLADEIPGLLAGNGIAWSHDESGMFYLVHQESECQTLRFHRFGTECSEDIVVFAGEKGINYAVQSVGDFLVLYSLPDGDVNYGISYRRTSDSDSQFKPLLPYVEARQWVVDQTDEKFYLITNWMAPRNRVISVNVTTGEIEEVVPEAEAVLQFASAYFNRSHRVLAYEWAGRASLIHLQPDGTQDKLDIQISEHDYGATTDFMSFSGFKVANDHQFSFRAENYILPPTIFQYDLIQKKSTRAFAWQAQAGEHDPALFVTSEITATSADGTLVPVFICHRRDVELNGDNPTWLTAYGGFRIGVKPTFSAHVLSWIENGGIFAEALVRGGHEFGDKWHQDGRLIGRSNITDDLVAVAEALVAERYTSVNNLGIAGTSNGALLVASVLVRRPELFGCAVMRAGVFDLLRFHKFGFGRQWKSEYGDPEDPSAFETLLALSPLHNIVPAKYPALLIQVPTCDDRVDPSHSLKFYAAMQNAQLGEAPVLLRQYEGEGHSLNGKPSHMFTDLTCFLAAYTGLNRLP